MSENFNSLEKKIEYVDRLYTEKKYEEAIDACSEIIESNEGYYDAYRERSYSLYALYRYSDAFDDLDKLIQLRPTSPTAYMQRARWQIEQGNNELALADADVVIKMGDEYFLDSAYFHKAIACLNLGKKDESIEACQKLPSTYKSFVGTSTVVGRLLSREELLNLARQGKTL